MSSEEIKYDLVPNNDELRELVHEHFRDNYVEVDGYFMNETYSKNKEKVLDFEVRDDDVFVATFPKCGTTWTQEMVWCLLNDMDLEKAKALDIHGRSPFLEMSSTLKINFPNSQSPEYIANTLEFLKKMKERRCIKTHLPLRLMPRAVQSEDRKAKIIYVARDPRDVCVSYFYFAQSFMGFQGDMQTYIKLFINGQVLWGPFWNHIFELWNIRNSPNILFLTYEEMKRDLGAVIKRVSAFIGKTYTEEQYEKLKDHLSFQNMKKNPSVNMVEVKGVIQEITGVKEGRVEFMRSGKVGDHKSLNSEDRKALDEWCRKNLEGTDYPLVV